MTEIKNESETDTDTNTKIKVNIKNLESLYENKYRKKE